MASAVAMSRPVQFENQDPKMVQIYEIISSYFSDVFYNHVFSSSSAALNKSGGGKSLTDEYVRQTQAYLTGIKTDAACYKQANTDLYRYFSEFYKSLSFSQYVDRVVSQFVPDKTFSGLKAAEKDEIMGLVICGLVSALAAYSTKPELLRRIIDQHGVNAQVTHRMMQDVGITELITQRETLLNKFLKRQGQSRDLIPANVVENLKETVRKLVRAKQRAEDEADSLYEELRAAKKKLKDASVRESKYRQIIALLRGASSTEVRPEALKDTNTSLHEDFGESGESGEESEYSDEPQAPRHAPTKKFQPSKKQAVASDFFKKAETVPASESKRAVARAPPRTDTTKHSPSEKLATSEIGESSKSVAVAAADPLEDIGEPITEL